MKSGIDCFPCFLKQAHSSVTYATEDEARQWQVMTGAAPVLAGLSLDQNPAYNSSLVLHKVNELLGMADPYAAAKKSSNEKALAMLPVLRERIKGSEDKLQTAVRLAVAGNVIDLGIKHEADLETTIEEALGDGFARFEYESFKSRLDSSKNVLYVLDNAGEIVFDRLLIEGLRAHGKMVIAVVKGGPILNDATMEDAAAAGLDKLVKVIDTGSDFVGINREKASPLLLKALDTADLVIAKGQGNYETLDALGPRAFFILKAKCNHVARALGVKLGDLVLAQGP